MPETFLGEEVVELRALRRPADDEKVRPRDGLALIAELPLLDERAQTAGRKYR